MMSIASSSISSRTSIGGQRCPRMCSFSASPLPIPKARRSPKSCAVVATAWATTAGWMRKVGHTTAVHTCISVVACAMAPSTDQTKGLCP
jgi:hypothetical protein